MDNEYIIDFDRINELTITMFDHSEEKSPYGNSYSYSITRKILKEYLDIYTGSSPLPKGSSSEYVKNITDTLLYNRILVSKSDIRDGKLSKILND